MKGLLDRLEDKFLVDDGCWEWIGSRFVSGYGSFWDGKRNRRAHRVIYELMVGPIPADTELDHLCRNKLCVRPDHLEPVSHGENMARVDFSHRRPTDCPRGHSYEVHAYRRKNGKLSCGECRRERYKRSGQ